jgi:uncharacterized protein (TIGR03435 family)
MKKRVMWALVIAALPVSAADLTGTWQGMLASPRGEFRTVIKVSRGDGAALRVSLYNIDQSAVENPGSMTVQGSNVRISTPGSSGTFDGKLSPDGSSISGTWTRGGVAMALNLKRVNDDAAWTIPKFDVASIKLSALGIKQVSEVQPLPGGRIHATEMSVMGLIQVAYRLRPFEITGGPGWLDSARYDIEAKSDNPANAGAWQIMLQSLLADRFQLKFHRETKELPVYALVLARKDGKLGPSLNVSKEGGCVDRNLPSANQSSGPFCGGGTGRGKISGLGMPIGGVAALLSRMLDHAVIDKTGLTGKFDFQAHFTPDGSQATDSPNPSLFTALQEQLGLKLEPQKGPVEILVIDGVQKPKEN